MRRLLLDVMAASQEPPPLCRRIREERKRLGISQEEAARRLHLSLKGYTAYERYREPKPSRAREIAVAFGLPENHFESREEPPPDQVAELREEVAELRDLALQILDALGQEVAPPASRGRRAARRRPA